MSIRPSKESAKEAATAAAQRSEKKKAKPKRKKEDKKKAKRAAKEAAKAAAQRETGGGSNKRLLRDSTEDGYSTSSKRLCIDHPHAEDAQAAAKSPRQLTVMQIIAQPPNTVDMAELQRLRNLPSVANAVTSEEEDELEEDIQRIHGPDISEASAQTVPSVTGRSEQRVESDETAAASTGCGDSTASNAARTAARVAKRKKKGEKQLASGDAHGAIATFKAALALAPDDRDALLLKSTAEMKLQKPKKDRSEEKKLRRRQQKAAKRAKLQAHLAEKGGRNAVVTPSVASEHPFEVTDEKDHAETPFDA